MPLGAARLNTLSKVLTTAAATRGGFVNITSFGQVQLSNAQMKFSTGTRGGSILFDGTGDYALADNQPLFPATDDFTAECFVYFTDTSGDKAIFSQHGDSGTSNAGSRFFIAVQSNNKVDVYLRNSGNSDWSFRIFGTTTISTNTWTHVAVVRNSNTFTLYINGTNDGSASSSDSIIQSDFAIGALSNNGAYDLLGYIDEIRISDTARYTGNFTAPTSAFTPDVNTKLLLHGDGPYGSDGNFHIVDDIGDLRPIDVHIQTAYTVGSGSAPSISTAQAKFGSSSFRMNDNSGHCQFPTPEWGSELTLEFWFKPDSTSAGLQHMSGVWGGSPHGGFNHLISLSGANVRCYVFGGSTFRLNNVLIGTISNTDWHHVAITWDGSTYRTFLDGTMGATSSSSDAPGFDQHQVTWVGTVGGTSDTFAGYIDEYRQSKTARYTANFTPSGSQFTNDANTQVLLHFNGTNGDTTTTDDAS